VSVTITRPFAAPGARSLSTRILAGAVLSGILAEFVFLISPDIDQIFSGVFHIGNGAFSGQSSAWAKMLRNLFLGIFYLSIAVSLVGLFMTRGRTRTWLHLEFAQWSFLAICIAVGPGLVANVIFKDHWGRARPKQIIEFGGAKSFTPPLIPTNQCTNNCSFVSGEAASIFMPFYAAALMLPQWAGLTLISGTVLGLAAGFVRVTQGAHFLSDVIFAGVFMALTAALVHRAMQAQVSRREPVDAAAQDS
jgi:lipid A 4'-phosphatase